MHFRLFLTAFPNSSPARPYADLPVDSRACSLTPNLSALPFPKDLKGTVPLVVRHRVSNIFYMAISSVLSLTTWTFPMIFDYLFSTITFHFSHICFVPFHLYYNKANTILYLNIFQIPLCRSDELFFIILILCL